jgi:hypothetical protein
MKVFEPKITKGDWVWDQEMFDDEGDDYSGNLPELTNVMWFGSDTMYYPTEGVPPNKQDAMAIAAVPELLEVYKAAKVVADTHVSSTMRMSMLKLKSAVGKLEEKHGVEK